MRSFTPVWAESPAKRPGASASRCAPRLSDVERKMVRSNAFLWGRVTAIRETLVPMESLNKFLKELFDEDSVWIGWSVYWRALLLTFLVSLPLSAIAVREELAFVSGVLSALAAMAILGSVVKRVALDSKLAPSWVETVSIGWATFWRYLLLGLVGLLPISAISLFVAAALGREWIALIISLPFNVLWLSACMGWAVSRVKRLVELKGDSGSSGSEQS